jgi:hypothetical protein
MTQNNSDSRGGIKSLLTGLLAGMLPLLAAQFLLGPGYRRVDFYDEAIALILAGSLAVSVMSILIANLFWCKIPVSLRGCRQLSFFLAFTLPVLALWHPEMNLEALLIWKLKPGNIMLLALIVNAWMMMTLIPWFTRRFFFPQLED